MEWDGCALIFGAVIDVSCVAAVGRVVAPDGGVGAHADRDDAGVCAAFVGAAAADVLLFIATGLRSTVWESRSRILTDNMLDEMPRPHPARRHTRLLLTRFALACQTIRFVRLSADDKQMAS